MSALFGGDKPVPIAAAASPAAEKAPPKDAALREQMIKQRAVGGGIAYSDNEYDALSGRKKKLGASNDILG